jgi:hypothetical protein
MSEVSASETGTLGALGSDIFQRRYTTYSMRFSSPSLAANAMRCLHFRLPPRSTTIYRWPGYAL